jgi:hypothetical protein
MLLEELHHGAIEELDHYRGFHLSEKTVRFPRAVPGASIQAGNASLIPAYLLALFI